MSTGQRGQRGKIYGERIRQARELRGLLAEELAERLGVPAEMVLAWERDEASPRVSVFGNDEWGALVLALGFPPAFFRQPPAPSDLERSSLNWHGVVYLCDKCDEEIGVHERESIGEQDFHAWCAPPARGQ